MTDKDLLTIAAAGALIGAALWWWKSRQQDQGDTEPDEQESDYSFMTQITNAASDAADTVGRALWMPPAAAAPYLAAIAAAESRYGLPQNMLARLLYQESHFRQDVITGKTRSSVGALGIAQFMPATAREMGIDPLDPAQAIDAAGKYLARLYGRFGNWSEALAAYNWGQGNVARKGLDAAPTETRNYFAQILTDLGIS